MSDTRSSTDSRLRVIGQKIETLIREAEAVLDDANWPDARDDALRRVLHLSLRDLASAHALIFRASLAERGVVQRVLGSVLGRPLVDGSRTPSARQRKTQPNMSDGSVALDPFRTGLADSALDLNRLIRSLSAVRLSMAECEVDREPEMPDWPDPVINFAGGMVEGAVESLEEARQLLFGAADLTEDRLVHIWAERKVGTDKRTDESNQDVGSGE